MLCPATTIVPVRGDELGLEATVKLAMPFAVPGDPDESVSQGRSDTAVQLHPADVVTETANTPLEAGSVEGVPTK